MIKPKIDDAEVYAEGRVSYALHRKLERNPKIAKKVKNNRLREKGDLCCDVCGFSFHERYGAIGIGFIEAHHTVPVSSLKSPRATKLPTWRLVCQTNNVFMSTPLLLDSFTRRDCRRHLK
jgi:predicted HNH restriction endonuclease